MDELIAFLNERLAEDERLAIAARDEPETGWWWSEDAESAPERHIARHDPARVLADVAAKRAIVEAYEGAELERGDDPNDETRIADATTLRWVVCVLASAYAQHPDYREEWRPE